MDLGRVQKAGIRLILGVKYDNYEDGVLRANLESLKERREKLCKNFAIKCMRSLYSNRIFQKLYQ